MEMMEIEEIEFHYLNKYFHFLKFAEDEMFHGFKTKEAILSDWYGHYKSGISDFSVGAERVIYSLLNGKGIGQPNSAPVGADLFFEVDQAFIHLDLKTVGATLNPRGNEHPDGSWSNNIGDYNSSIFVGKNQNSYASEIKKSNGKSFDPPRIYNPSLPKFYKLQDDVEKLCLTYFITVLYDKDTLDILVMTVICMPNGSLYPVYKEKVLKAGKNLDKTRFNFLEVDKFELLPNKPSRVKVVYYSPDMPAEYDDKLTFFKKLI